MLNIARYAACPTSARPSAHRNATRGCWQRARRSSVGCRDAASGLYLDWASHVMSLHHSPHRYSHVALRADIANYLSFWETVSMACLGCRLGSSNSRHEQPRLSPPAGGSLCMCLCLQLCTYLSCLCLCLCPCSVPRLLSEMPTRTWSRLVGSDKASQSPATIHAGHPSYRISTTAARLVRPLHLHLHHQTHGHLCQANRPAAWRLFVQRGSRLATRSETWRRDDAHSAVTTNSSIRWHE